MFNFLGSIFKSNKRKFTVIFYVSLISFIVFFLKFLKPLEILYDACKNDDLEKVKDVLSKDSSLLNEELNEYGETALYLASDNNHSSIVSFLLEQKDIDANKADKVSYRF
jgi:ankyrin repeat protein